MVKATYKQTFIGIWFHDNKLSIEQKSKMILYLNRTFYYYRVFVKEDDFYAYVGAERLAAKIFLIISVSRCLLQKLLELTTQSPNTFEKSLYIFTLTKYYIYLLQC